MIQHTVIISLQFAVHIKEQLNETSPEIIYFDNFLECWCYNWQVRHQFSIKPARSRWRSQWISRKLHRGSQYRQVSFFFGLLERLRREGGLHGFLARIRKGGHHRKIAVTCRGCLTVNCCVILIVFSNSSIIAQVWRKKILSVMVD